MAVVVVRTSFTKNFVRQVNVVLSRSDRAPTFRIFSANISGKYLRDPNYKRPAPFPYKDKLYLTWHRFGDATTDRFDDNSKIIVVEGSVAAGKTAFAKELAKDLDMLHLPKCNMDSYYINDYGFDLRQLDDKLPKSIRSFDEKDFCKDPFHFNAANFQLLMYKLKFEQCILALAHLLNTGQGVVMERCVYSDFVFVEAMLMNGFISKGAHDVYYDLIFNTIQTMLHPHLIIYLDVPVEKLQERIKSRALPHEVNSKALTTKFLTDLEYQYKEVFLKEISQHSEVLIYDWSDYGEVEVVVEDLERIDFDCYTPQDMKMHDWYRFKEQHWGDIRELYTNHKAYLMGLFNIPRYDVPELVISGEDSKIASKVYGDAPGMQYAPGFNRSMGDSVLWKTKIKY